MPAVCMSWVPKGIIASYRQPAARSFGSPGDPARPASTSRWKTIRCAYSPPTGLLHHAEAWYGRGRGDRTSLVTNAIANAQRKVEGRNFDIRKQLLEYDDDAANDQRKVVYEQRNELMNTDDISAHHCAASGGGQRY